MDVVWLKRDVRLHDHGPLSAVLQRQDGPRDVCILYLYEPDQLAEPTVHGSHIAFVNEGLLDLDKRLLRLRNTQQQQQQQSQQQQSQQQLDASRDSDSNNNDATYNENNTDNKNVQVFEALTVCYAEIVSTLQAIAEHGPIGRILAHMETGHLASYQRDKRVRRWCKSQEIPFVEMQQTGVSRGLKDRDRFSSGLARFLDERPLHPTPPHAGASSQQRATTPSSPCRIVTDMDLPGRTRVPLLQQLEEIPQEHRSDRPSRRQVGGETEALATLRSFLDSRGKDFSMGISSPNTAWLSCSRLSPYLTWGHISLRYVYREAKKRQSECKLEPDGGGWGRSLSAFLSRLRWRSHFIQKLESEPELEHRDACPAYRTLRRQPGDWNEDFFAAWRDGRTGFPLVDACMRFLRHHGWINFRMRAMLVSFATHNLWLDWNGRLASHLARVFLDYEPGIHYPQLQMQAGTTGINAMRVYSVTKQAKDQDPHGHFIRKYVRELAQVPDQYIHELWKMPISIQKELGVRVGIDYPKPIVDEKESARAAKERLSQVRKLEETKKCAQAVYQKHGSRNHRHRDSFPGALTQPVVTKKARTASLQPTIKSYFAPTTGTASAGKESQTHAKHHHRDRTGGTRMHVDKNGGWNCRACTFSNTQSLALACEACGTHRTPQP